MGDISIRCPITGKAVATGLTTETIVFESLPALELPLTCDLPGLPQGSQMAAQGRMGWPTQCKLGRSQIQTRPREVKIGQYLCELFKHNPKPCPVDPHYLAVSILVLAIQRQPKGLWQAEGASHAKASSL
jgi:hypothetical protein